jgi:CheY-like chemotaxis protein
LLVVEDEEFIREGICEFLRSLGYTVFAASSGEEALLIAGEQEQIDLLLTDVVMPKMSGRELSQMLGSLRPDLKTIHMSGYTDDALLRHDIQKSSATFLQSNQLEAPSVGHVRFHGTNLALQSAPQRAGKHNVKHRVCSNLQRKLPRNLSNFETGVGRSPTPTVLAPALCPVESKIGRLVELILGIPLCRIEADADA